MPWCSTPQTFSPRLRSSATTTSMPFLSIVRSPWLDTRREIQRFSLGTQKRRSWRFGSQRRRVLLFAWETLLPDWVPFPVTWQILAIANLVDAVSVLGQDGGGPAAAMRHAVLEFPVLSTRADRMAAFRVPGRAMKRAGSRAL